MDKIIKAPEYACPICGKVFDRYKALHGHCLMAHRAEFAERGYSLAGWGIRKDPMENIVRTIEKAAAYAESGLAGKGETR